MPRSSISIGITTKDRWHHLAGTLDTLERQGLSKCETIVIDDGSRCPMPEAFRDRFGWVRFERCEISRGYIVQRNRLAEMLNGELYLSLDDDSYPAPDAPLDDAAKWLIGKEDAVALAFSIGTPFGDANSSLPVADRPHPVRYYIGCAHMLKRELFRALGGYTESLRHYCEETDFALKAWKDGFRVYKYPALVVIHNKSAIGRNSAAANRLLTRNLIWVSSWRSPFVLFVLELSFRVLRMLRLKEHRVHWKAVLRGYFEALVGLPRVLKFRDPLSLRRYLAWLKNPVELE
ncbi:MAG TPA: glycosyltransferase [Terrimicrobiaceae bacterium]